MFNHFDNFNLFIFGKSGNNYNKYNPYINYSWSQTLTVGGNQQIKDSGTAGLNLQQYFGQGVWFNGSNMQVTIPVNETIKTEIKRVNGVVEIKTNTQSLTNYNVYSGTGAKVYKDVYLFSRQLTQAEIDIYNNQPNQFFLDSLEDDSCILAMPMCEKGNLVRNYKNNTDYPISNYLATCRTNAQRLRYGLQTSGFKRDTNGMILSKSDFLECDGVGYCDTGYASPLEIVPESFEIIVEKPKVLQYGHTKLVCGTFLIDMGIEFIANTNSIGNAVFRKLVSSFGNAHWMPNNTMLVTMVCDGDNVFIYFNGVLSGTKKAQPYTASSTIKLSVNQNNTTVLTSGVNQGGIRLFKVHQKALTQDEVIENFNTYKLNPQYMG